MCRPLPRDRVGGARAADCRHRARDQEPPKFRQQLCWPLGGIGNLDRGELIYPDLQREHAAYEYAKQRGERVHSLHVAMNDLRVFHGAS